MFTPEDKGDHRLEKINAMSQNRKEKLNRRPNAILPQMHTDKHGWRKIE